MNVAHFRELMPITREWAYFDHAAVAPLPQPTRNAIVQWADQASQQGDVVWPRWASSVESVRRTAANLFGATADEIALVSNTTAAISIVAEGFPWQAGDNVVTLANEFPSNLYPWMNLESRGVETRRVPVTGSGSDQILHDLAQACDARTRMLAVSWVSYSTGYRLNIEQLVDLAHRRGILVMLDAIQGMGVFPLHLERSGIDFAAADGHKWMLGPEGAGILYVRREHLEKIRPTSVGWHSVAHSHDFSKIELALRPDAARFEGGSQNMAGLIGLGASLELLASLGLTPEQSPIADQVLQINDEACSRLSRLGAEIYRTEVPDAHSGILSFAFPRCDPQQLRHACLDGKAVLSCRAGRLRISPHGYCSNEDLDCLTDALGYGIKRVSG